MSKDAQQQRLPFAAAEAHQRENLDLLRRAAKRLGVKGNGVQLLIRITSAESGTRTRDKPEGDPLRKTYAKLGELGWGLGCSARTAFRVVEELRACNLITVKKIATGAGQRPNEYRIHWPGVRAALGLSPSEMTEPDCQSVQPQLPNCQSPIANLSEPDCQIVNHSITSPSSKPLLQAPSSTTTTEALSSRVFEVEEEQRDAWILAAYELGVQKAEEAVSEAIAAGRDVGKILRWFRRHRRGWDRKTGSWYLYCRLMKSPPGIKVSRGWPAFDNPKAVEFALEKRRRKRPPPPVGVSAAEIAQQRNREFLLAESERLKSLTPDEREAELLEVVPKANQHDRDMARKLPNVLAIKFLKLKKGVGNA